MKKKRAVGESSAARNKKLSLGQKRDIAGLEMYGKYEGAAGQAQVCRRSAWKKFCLTLCRTPWLHRESALVRRFAVAYR